MELRRRYGLKVLEEGLGERMSGVVGVVALVTRKE